MNSSFINKWKKEASQILKNQFPDMKKEKIDSYLDKKIKENLKNFELDFYNNYSNTTFESSGLDLLEWIKNEEPILGSHGTFFKTHDKSPNPAAKMLDKFLALRKKFKKIMFDYKQEYAKTKDVEKLDLSKKFNIAQLNEKINANAW